MDNLVLVRTNTQAAIELVMTINNNEKKVMMTE